MLLAHVAISVFCLSGGIALLAKAYELIRRANKED
jgi:hypothetical protein